MSDPLGVGLRRLNARIAGVLALRSDEWQVFRAAA